jgi:hypothetical protein
MMVVSWRYWWVISELTLEDIMNDVLYSICGVEFGIPIEGVDIIGDTVFCHILFLLVKIIIYVRGIVWVVVV